MSRSGSAGDLGWRKLVERREEMEMFGRDQKEWKRVDW